MNATNIRLESINGTLKQVINRHSSLDDFINNFLVILTTLLCNKSTSCNYVSESEGATICTRKFRKRVYQAYTASFVLKQMELASKVKKLMRRMVSMWVKERRSLVLQIVVMCFTTQCSYTVTSKLGQALFDSSVCDK